MSGAGETRRCFFAIWPDEAVRVCLDAWSGAVQTDASARRVPGSKLHITLVFLGALTPPQMQAVCDTATRTRWRAARLVLDRIGYWKRSQIVWAGSRSGSPPLAELAENLRGRLRRLGFRVDERPFVPHVTLYRKARRRPKWRSQEIEWDVHEFCLVESILSPDGARYRIVDRWCADSDMK